MTDKSGPEPSRPADRKRRNAKRSRQRLLIRALVVLMLAACVLYLALYRYVPSFEIGSVYDYEPNMRRNSMNVMLGGEVLAPANAPVMREGRLYLPVEFVREYFDPYVFWEPEADRLTFTTEKTVVVMKTGEPDYTVNGRPAGHDAPILRLSGTAYIPESLMQALPGIDERFAQPYHFDMRYEEELNIVIIDRRDAARSAAAVTKDVNMRFEPDIKSPVAQRLTQGESLDVLDVLEGDEDFTKVRLTSGLTGFVPTKNIGKMSDVPPVPAAVAEPMPQLRPAAGKVALLWDQVFNEDASASQERRATVGGIDVISPTWFSFDAEAMETDDPLGAEAEEYGAAAQNIADIVSIGNAAYAEAAHANGYQVWPLISDNFNAGVSHAILTNPENRDSVISQLLSFVEEYGVDGINIDFEAVLEADAAYYLQFLRELNPMLKELGAALSVDLYVPLYTKYYNRTEVAKVVDYVCVMTYDEHYSGSETTGPVASLGFVEEGVAATLAEVPKEKVLMGLPFYVRVWTEKEDEDGNVTFYKQDTTMQNGFNQFAQSGVEFIWNQDLGCYYGEYETVENGAAVTKKVWLEDERSIAEKLKVAQKYDLAGVACWKRYLEKRGVWTEIQNYKAAYEQ